MAKYKKLNDALKSLKVDLKIIADASNFSKKLADFEKAMERVAPYMMDEQTRVAWIIEQELKRKTHDE